MLSAAKRLFAEAKEGNITSFAKLLSWLESSDPKQALALTELLQTERVASRFGITGPPGAGKSTLVSRLIQFLRDENLKVGVIAVDPSSPFSGGAILGDRIRYSDHSLDPRVFVRSLGSRGSLGGLSASAYLMLRAFDACGFDVVLIETVGVGQTELDILHVADQVTVVLVPESGDSIQAMKAGLMEIADVFLVNKSDRPGADSLAREIKSSVHDGESGKQPPVFSVIATEGKGLDDWFSFVKKHINTKEALKNRRDPKRLQEEAKALLRWQWEQKVAKKLKSVKTPKDLRPLVSK
jgi:LAO/AO transport system kinase